MEPSFQRYIWQHTRRQQVWILCVVVLSMLPYYLALDLPRQIVNGPILGEGFVPGVTQPFAPASLDLPWLGRVDLVPPVQLDRTGMLVALSLAFLALVVVNGLFKYYINIFKGLLGERLLRRLRYELVDLTLRFRAPFFRRVKGGEIATMIKDEVEPLGGFTGDAFVQPAFLGGQALTALGFIMAQNFWLGLIAAATAALQIAIIPRLRRRLIELGRQRQLTARALAGRVTEVVDGIQSIHAWDTSTWERADMADRLGLIFRIRYAIYRRKFMVKFLNNFIAQITPFIFYLVGGWYAIRGELDVGQLVAVINAYKELPGPLRDLIDWDLARQDVQVKYEQVVAQFAAGEPVDPAAQDPAAASVAARGVLAAEGLTVEDGDGQRLLDGVTLAVAPGERLAILGDSASRAEVLGEALAGLQTPVAGRVMLGGADLATLPEPTRARAIAYAGAEGYFFFGTLRENLVYPLRHAPLPPAVPPAPDAARAARLRAREAARSGNPDLDPAAPWIDPDRLIGAGAGGDPMPAILSVLEVVGLSGAVLDYGLSAQLDPEAEPATAAALVSLRGALREALQAEGRAHLVVPFEPGGYNTEATVQDNLLFGMFRRDAQPQDLAEAQALMDRVLAETGLQGVLAAMGRRIAETTFELFRDLPRDNPLVARLRFLGPDDLGRIEALVARPQTAGDPPAGPDRTFLTGLALRYVEPQFRLGLIDGALRARIVVARARLAAAWPARLAGVLDRYEPGRYLAGASVLENLVFGRVNLRHQDAERALRAAVAGQLERQPDLWRRVMALGLDHPVGAGGRQLPLVQRQQANLARALLRRAEVYVLNRPLAALDPALQARIVERSLAHLQTAGSPAVAWVLSNAGLADRFERRVTVVRGRIVSPPAGDALPLAATAAGVG